MKKLLLTLLLSTISFITNAQTFLEENFDALGSPITLPTGWTQTNQSLPLGTVNWFRGNTSSFNSYNGPADGYIATNYQSGTGTATLSNWLMAPPVTVQNGDEVTFYSRIPLGTEFPDRVYLRRSDLGANSTAPTGVASLGSYTTECLVINPNLVPNIYPKVWTKFTYVVSGLSGPTSCRFALHHSVTNGGPDGNNSLYVGFDKFIIKRLIANDLGIVSVTVPAIIAAGNFTFNGTVENNGSNTVTSYQVTWQAGGAGVNNTHNVTGVSIAPGTTHDFSHSVPLNAVVGQSYALNFTITNVNSVTDADISNNSLARNTQVASGSTTYNPMFEKFTGSTCGPCAAYNNNTFNSFYTAQNQNFNYVAYQMNWPGAGDPYYTLEGNTRKSYYDVTGITDLRINGAEYSTANNQATLTTHMNTEAAKPGYFGLLAGRDIAGGNATVNYVITPYISGNYTLHAAVIEKTTTGNIGTNGETSFKHVMMKMVPNASGTAITTTAGTPINGQISASLAGTFIEDMTDLEVVVFIQNNVTKQVMQSKTAQVGLLSNDSYVKNKINIFPNPANDFIKLSNIDQANIVITDITGKVVLNQVNVSEDASINISNLTSGVYFVSVNTENIQETIKFIKK
jgi:hypothetical protein